MNDELKYIYEWLCINPLSLNISTTNFVIFHAINKIKSPVTILINKQAIDEAEYVKYLGILIDAHLTFRHHIDELTKKVSRGIGMLYKLRPFVTTKILTSIYYAIIYPFLLYGITVWGVASKTLLTPIHVLQKRFVRMATFNDNFNVEPGPLQHTPPLLFELKLLTIFDIFNLQLGKLVYDSINNIGPTHSIIQLTRAFEIHDHQTRYATQGKFHNHYVRTTRFGLKSLKIMGGNLWNTIPYNVKNCQTKKSFISSYKRTLLKPYIDN